MNATQIGSGPEVILCYNTIQVETEEDEAKKDEKKKSKTKPKNNTQSVVMSIAISKDTESTSGYLKKSTTDSLAMDASFNQNPQHPNFYLCLKTGDKAPQKQIQHPLNGTYAWGEKLSSTTTTNSNNNNNKNSDLSISTVENIDGSTGEANGEAGGESGGGSFSTKKNQRLSLYATDTVDCVLVDAKYQIWRPRIIEVNCTDGCLRSLDHQALSNGLFYQDTKQNARKVLYLA